MTLTVRVFIYLFIFIYYIYIFFLFFLKDYSFQLQDVLFEIYNINSQERLFFSGPSENQKVKSRNV